MMGTPRVDGADRMRQAEKVIAAIAEKLDAHRPKVGEAQIIHITCRIDRYGKVEVSLQTTY